MTLPRRSRGGYTVVEMIVVLVMTAILLAGAFGAYASAFGYDERARAARGRAAAGRGTEDRLRAWISRAALSSVATDPDSYFVATADAPNTLTFTAEGDRLPSSFAASNDPFETANDRFGPQGGTAEVSFSLTGVGDGASRTGLFLRVQRPADGDPSQGGYQELLDADVESVTYEFWNGTDWETAWNTQAQGTPRLPAAVRVTYRRKGESADRVLTVGVPASDVAADNPVVAGGAG